MSASCQAAVRCLISGQPCMPVVLPGGCQPCRSAMAKAGGGSAQQVVVREGGSDTTMLHACPFLQRKQ